HATAAGQAGTEPNVLRGILRWDGWTARPTSPPDQIALDLAEIDGELARQGSSRAARGFVVAHENFLWLSEKARREDAIAEQKERMLKVVSDERPWEYIETVYLAGTIDEVQ